jgi:DNA-binding NtrC family response regulator
MSRVLIVDDKEMMRDSVAATLQRAGMTVVAAPNADAALGMLGKHRPDVVLTDLRMPGTDGLGLLEQLKNYDESLPVVLMTAYGTVDTAVEAMKLGAFDYITKPFEGDELIITVKRALQHAKLVKENAVLQTYVPQEAGSAAGAGLDRLVGGSAVMQHLRSEIAAVARSSGTVLVCGESGTGKELVSRAIHEASARAEQTYLAVNCAALSASLLESELFGHERGAFTGADQLRKGRFELADGGSLLLDEISEIAPHLQAKLLRVLQESAFERVGSSVTQSVDVRVIATTNRELLECVQDGSFRQDLYFRLTVLPIRVPPLRERLDDVPELARHFLARVARRDGTAGKHLSDDALGVMQQYDWPGNVRELQNICERAHVLSPSERIEADLLRPWLLRGEPAGGRDATGAMGATTAGSPVGAASVSGAASTQGVGPAAVAASAGGPNGAAASTGTPAATGGRGTGTSAGAMMGSGATPRPPAEGLRPPSRPAATPAWMAGDNGSPHVDPDDPPPPEIHVTVDESVRPLEEVERQAVVAALREFDGHRQKTAAALGIGVRTLGLKLKKWKQQDLVEQDL